MLDKIDIQLLRKSIMVSSKSSRSLLLLELGVVPVEYLLKQKRINFLHHLLTSEDQSLAKAVFLKQTERPMKGDYVNIVNKDLVDCKINLTYDQIKTLTKKKFKEIEKEAVRKASLQNLLNEKRMLSKGNDLKYEELKTQSYLLPGNNLSINDMRRILQIRIRDIPVRRNFPNAHKSQNCLFKGCTEEETQAHLFNSSCWTKERNITASNSVK